MRCETAKTLLSPFLDGALSGSEREEVGAHVALCAGCGGALDSLRSLSALLKSFGQAPLPAGFHERLARRRVAKSAAGRLPVFTAAFAAAGLVLVVVRNRPAPPVAPPPMTAAVSSDAADAVVPAGKDGPLALSAPASSVARGGQPVGARKAYSNEAMQKMLQEETRREGLVIASKDDVEENRPEPFLGRQELGAVDTREQAENAIRQIAAMRHEVERGAGKKREVAIGVKTAPALLAKADAAGQGAAIDEDKPARDKKAVEAPVAFARGESSGRYSGGLEGARTILDAKAWAEAWGHLSKDPVPAVDFNAQEIVAVFLGARPTGGYAVQIASVGDEGPALVVRWRELAPEPGKTPPEGATSPFALKAVPRTDLPVRFEKVP